MDLKPLFKAIATPAGLYGRSASVSHPGTAGDSVQEPFKETGKGAVESPTQPSLESSIEKKLERKPEVRSEARSEVRSIDKALVGREPIDNLSGQPVATPCGESFSRERFRKSSGESCSESSTAVSKATSRSSLLQTTLPRAGHWKFFGASVNQDLKVDEVVKKIDSGQLWVVNSRRRNGLIVVREFHAEFAGPGAAVGGDLDEGILEVIPIGNLSLLEPDSHEAHQNAIKIRLQWIRLTQNFTDQPSPDDRARMILEQFKTYFDQDTVDLVSDEAFALLVGVLPQTIRRVRSGFVW
jgi:hypothetical protein